MTTVTIPKATYERLKRHAEAYRRIAANFFKTAIEGSAHDVLEDLQDHVRFEIAARESKGKKRSSLSEIKKRYGLK